MRSALILPGRLRPTLAQRGGGDAICGADGPCKRCAAESLGHGTRDELIESIQAGGVAVNPVSPPDVRVPMHSLR